MLSTCRGVSSPTHFFCFVCLADTQLGSFLCSALRLISRVTEKGVAGERATG